MAEYSLNHPFGASVLERVNLNRPGSAKATFHVALSLAGSGITYTPGDALGVWPLNHDDLVGSVIAQLDLAADAPVVVRGDAVTLFEALQRLCEITAVTRPVVKKYAALSDAAVLQELLAAGQHQALLAWSAGRDLLDLLQEFPVPGLGAQELVDLLRPLPPRLYSIASSQRVHPDQVHLTVGMVQYRLRERQRYGVCSSYLSAIEPGQEVPVYHYENRHFRLPEDGATPIIMIGPGTGVAPYRAFLEERQARGDSGANWLFFGDQHAATDFLYEADLRAFQQRGVLNRLDLAFSRDQAEKVYVQHRLEEQAAEVYRWLEEGAVLYVCGDALRMAPAVHATLVSLIARQGAISAEEAEARLSQFSKANRYQLDTY
jgi:sulfite reductase (NADPH) flavoprotein alpha-component